MKKVNVGLIGLGTVGTGVARQLLNNKSWLQKKLNFEIELYKICDIDLKRERGIKIPAHKLTTDIEEIVANPAIDIVIELIGGIKPAKDYILKAIENKKHVITANKALLAEEGQKLFALAMEHGVELGFEASVAGGVPIIKAIREALVSNRITALMGIVNGTTNYILTRMEESGMDMKTIIKEAQEKGYAERDPRLDVNGIDSAHKIVILSRLAFGFPISFKDVYVEGISDISPLDIYYAHELGYCIKLLAIAKRAGRELEVRVHPTLIPQDHLLAAIRGVYNGIFLKADLVGNMLFSGRGAGQNPTSSAIIADLIDICSRLNSKDSMRKDFFFDNSLKAIKPIQEIISRYYIRFMVIDKPGVLAKISGILGRRGISIASVTQKERKKAGVVPIVMVTHEAKEGNMRSALKEIAKLDVVRKKPVAIRMED